MKEIGGYFGLELQKGKETFHDAPAFKSGRSALHYILAKQKPTKVYIPFYTCNGLFEAFEAAKTEYTFYSVNINLEPENLPELKEGEYFLYINYFGIKTKTVVSLIKKYKEKLIIDSSQAFFYKGDGQSWCFNSCRKFFGVPDGSYLYNPTNIEIHTPNIKNEEYTVEHLIERFNGNVEKGHQAFSQNENLCNADIKNMSTLSEQLLSNIDYGDCIIKRKQNFSILHQYLAQQNDFTFDYNDNDVPMVYPFLISEFEVHPQLWQQNLYVPVFWKDVLKRELEGFETEKNISRRLLPLPIDHRYTEEDMFHIIKIIEQQC